MTVTCVKNKIVKEGRDSFLCAYTVKKRGKKIRSKFAKIERGNAVVPVVGEKEKGKGMALQAIRKKTCAERTMPDAGAAVRRAIAILRLLNRTGGGHL